MIPKKRRDNKGYKYLKARLQCDGDIIHDNGFLFFSKETNSRVYDFDWYYNQENAQRISVKFSNQVRQCQFRFYDPDESKTRTHGFDLTDLSLLSQEWVKLTNQIDVCASPQGNFSDSVSSFFWQKSFNFTTCPETFDNIVNLRDPYISMNRKIISLTGSPFKKKRF